MKSRVRLLPVYSMGPRSEQALLAIMENVDIDKERGSIDMLLEDRNIDSNILKVLRQGDCFTPQQQTCESLPLTALTDLAFVLDIGQLLEYHTKRTTKACKGYEDICEVNDR